MARTTLAVATLLMNKSILAPVATVINSTLVTNGAVTDAIKHGGGILRVDNSTVSAKTVTIANGASAGRAGALVVPVPASSTHYITIDTGRFASALGLIAIDFEVGMTGSISVIPLI